MVTRPLVRIGIACLVLLTALAPTAFAFRIYTSGNADGEAWKSYYQSNASGWVFAESAGGFTTGASLVSSYSSYSDDYSYSYSWSKPVVEMPTALLIGMPITPGSVRLRFYSYGLSDSCGVYGLNMDPSGTVDTRVAIHVAGQLSGTVEPTLIQTIPSEGAGWIGIDVTSQVQSQVNAGYNWAGFYFSAAVGDFIGSSEGGYAAYLEVVPEPSSLMALLGGLAGMGVFVRRKR